MTKLKRYISLILAATMIWASIPAGMRPALAYDPDSYYVDSITLGKNFDSDGRPISMNLSIRGKRLSDADVFIEKSDGRLKRLPRPNESNDGLLYYVFARTEDWEDLSGIASITVGDAVIPIVGKDAMPSITEVTKKVNQDRDTLRIHGTKLSMFDGDFKDEFEMQYGNGAIYTTVAFGGEDGEAELVGDYLEIKKPQGELGLQDIIITRSFDTPEVDFNVDNEKKVKMNIKYTYLGQFRLVKDLNVDEGDIEMFPNRGIKGSKVYFKSSKLGNYDVYFLKVTDGTDPYTFENRGKNPILGEIDGVPVLTVEVPDIKPGEYIPVLTSRISSDSDPNRAITGEYIYTKEKFTVIQGSRSATIDSIQPATGPDTGSDAAIYGRYLGSLNIDDLNLKDGEISGPWETEIDGESLILKHPGIWHYREGEYRVEKRIKVFVGRQAEVKDSSTFNPTMDKIDIHIPDNTGEELVVDVVIETETLLKRDDGTIAYSFTERVEAPGGYIFIASSVVPEVTGVIPSQIFVRREGSDLYTLTDPLLLGIHGTNFTTYKVDGRQVKPHVQFDGVDVDMDGQDPIEILVLNREGDVLDGSSGNQEGIKILASIPAQSKISIPDVLIGARIPLRVTNPVRNSFESTAPSVENVYIQFIEVQDDTTPSIESVVPDVVTVEGGESVSIRGSNFREDVKVYIDGQEVSNIVRSGDAKNITFKAPPGREGDTQLQVLNPDGGMAIWDFKYVKTYTEPKIIDFSPRAGNTDTMVLVKGENFLAPDPAASVRDIDRLIGTKIYLGGEDINDYNLDPVTKKPQLKKYISPEGPILSIKEGKLHLADYWHSVVFTDDVEITDGSKFYTLRPDSREVPVLTDGIRETYSIKLSGGDLIATQAGGADYPLTVEGDSLVLHIDEDNKKTFTMYTPFTTRGNQIIGNFVKVLDNDRIIFRVPILTEGWYDVAVVNPDTKRDVKTGKDGFYYYEMIDSHPRITQVVPDKGSTDGGYTVDIIGEDFKGAEDLYSRVFINGIEISKDDTAVALGGERITAMVPAYPGDLRAEKGVDRLTVPVVVLNPDGASASLEDGFTYMVPTSHPEITRIVSSAGSAAGGEIVEITGKDFRYFEPFSDDNRNGRRDEGEPYSDLNENGEWDDFRRNALRSLMGDEYEPSLDNMENLKRHFSDIFEEKVPPVLPKVYFGGKIAEIVEYDDGYLKVITPRGAAGATEVYVVNNDSGISNKIQYTYVASKPTFAKIVPSEGDKKGGDKVEIFGSGFISDEVPIYGREIDLPDILVRFGNIGNHDIPRDQENSGRIDNNNATVKLPGGLTVEYSRGQFMVTVSESGKTFTSERLPFAQGPEDIDPDFTGPIYFPMSTLIYRDGDIEESYPGQELLRLEISDRRLLVERGYAPQAQWSNTGQILVTTPSYYTIGPVDVTVINPDGGSAQGKFEYKSPESKPFITDITKEGRSPEAEEISGRDVKVNRVTYKGGNIMSVIGSDFRENARIQIGDVITLGPQDITYMLPTKLTFAMPSVPETAVGKLHRVVVLNEDGGSTSSDDTKPLPIYIMFIKGETAPEVTQVSPDFGPASGGTAVTIVGKDFREGLKVYFGENPVPEDDLRVVDYKTIIVTSPPHAPGRVEVKVENPDGELSSPHGSFTYLSTPQIAAVVDPEDPTETLRIRQISVEGGQSIKVKGSGFVSPIRVVFNPVIHKWSEDDPAQGTRIFIDGNPYVLESGSDGLAQVADSETLLVTTPPGKVGTGDILAINPDGGASNIYDLKYTLPTLEAPSGVVAQLLYDRYIKVSWKAVEGAEGYEIYAITDRRELDFIGSTQLTDYIFTKPEPNTRYRFRVQAVGSFASSVPSVESNSVRTGRHVGPEDLDDGLSDNTTFQQEGDELRVIIGIEDYLQPTTVDMNQKTFAGAARAVVSIPAKVIAKGYAGQITVVGGDFTLILNPQVFSTARVRQYEDQDDAGVRFEIAPYPKSPDLGDKTLLSPQYNLDAKFFTGAQNSDMEYFASPLEGIFEYDRAKADLRKLDNVALYRYDDYSAQWLHISDRLTKESNTVKASLERGGRYAIMGTRGR